LIGGAGRAKAGMRMVKLPTAGIDYHAPFGGVGDSSYGPRERAASAFYTTTTTTYNWPWGPAFHEPVPS